MAAPTTEAGGAAPDAASQAAAGRLSAQALAAWRAFLRAHAMVTRRLEVDLEAQAGLALADYDVLVQLAQAEGRSLRMHELADRVLLSRGGLTRLVDRLEADGLVERRRCTNDARGFYAVLSQAGEARLREASPTHLAAVRRFFTDAYSESELGELAELLDRATNPAGVHCPVD